MSEATGDLVNTILKEYGLRALIIFILVVGTIIFLKFLGKKYIDNLFSKRASDHEFNQKQQLQRLQAQVDALSSGAERLRDKEFTVLPEAWDKLDQVYKHLANLVSPGKEYPDLNSINEAKFEEYLASSELLQSDKDELRNSTDPNSIYPDMIYRYRLSDTQNLFSQLKDYVASKRIFIPSELTDKFTEISDKYWEVMTLYETGQRTGEWKMRGEAATKFKESESLYDEIGIDIQKRLQAHGQSNNI